MRVDNVTMFTTGICDSHTEVCEAEIRRLERRDTNAESRTGLLRDAKHPTAKEGNHKRFKFTPEGWGVLERQPKTNECFFPYDPKSVCSAFTGACKILGIQDLRFHDLRHEATSRLFERGYQIHEVAQFTLHESWNELKRYTNLRPEKLREIPSNQSHAPSNERHNKRRKKTATFNQPLHVADQSVQQDRSH